MLIVVQFVYKPVITGGQALGLKLNLCVHTYVLIRYMIWFMYKPVKLYGMEIAVQVIE